MRLAIKSSSHSPTSCMRSVAIDELKARGRSFTALQVFRIGGARENHTTSPFRPSCARPGKVLLPLRLYRATLCSQALPADNWKRMAPPTPEANKNSWPPWSALVLFIFHISVLDATCANKLLRCAILSFFACGHQPREGAGLEDTYAPRFAPAGIPGARAEARGALHGNSCKG